MTSRALSRFLHYTSVKYIIALLRTALGTASHLRAHPRSEGFRARFGAVKACLRSRHQDLRRRRGDLDLHRTDQDFLEAEGGVRRAIRRTIEPRGMRKWGLKPKNGKRKTLPVSLAADLLESLDVLSLPALGSFDHVELDGLAFLQ